MTKRKAKRMQGHREPNGRLSRKRIHVVEREEMTQREAQSVAIEARMRLFGLTAEQAKQQEGGTVVGRMRQARELSADQAEAASTYLSARNAYHRAIGAVSDTGRIPLPEAEGCGSYEEFCEQAKKRWNAITEVVQCVMMELRSPAPVAALDNFIVRDVYVEHLVGDLRAMLNALHRHFSVPSRGARMITPLKPIPPRYKDGQRVRKSRKYAGAMASVYVVEYPKGDLVKVGYSASPIERTKALKCEVDKKLFLRWHAETTRDNAMAIERAFHTANKGHVAQAVGEWYSRGAESVIVEIMRIAEDLGVSLKQSGVIQTLKGAQAHQQESSQIGVASSMPLDGGFSVPYHTS